MTELVPLTNAVMQSFWFDNRTGIVYMTQARNNGYMLSRLRPNGQFIDSSLIVGGVMVHITVIDILMMSYGFIVLS